MGTRVTQRSALFEYKSKFKVRLIKKRERERSLAFDSPRTRLWRSQLKSFLQWQPQLASAASSSRAGKPARWIQGDDEDTLPLEGVTMTRQHNVCMFVLQHYRISNDSNELTTKQSVELLIWFKCWIPVSYLQIPAC